MKRVLTAAEIAAEVDRLGTRITAEFAGRPLTVLGVLTGSLVFLADLIRRIDLPLRVGLLQASSYRGPVTSPGELVVHEAPLPDVRGRHVLLVDDIFDTGRTLETVVRLVESRGPAAVRTAVLLRKRGRQVVEYEPDFHCFEIPDEFVVGYGLDYGDEYRHLPDLVALEAGDLSHDQPV
jgi:hypoxanthine phosphoribosyltransferase